MKKIMLFVGIACAISLQAASIDWKVANNGWYLSDGTTKPAEGSIVYLINAANWSDIETAIKGGKTEFSTSDVGILGVAATDNTRGRVSQTTATSSSLIAGTSYDFAYLVFDTAANKYFASGKQTWAAYDTNDAEYYETTVVPFTTTDYVTTGLSGGWQTPVPEPTSGLLLLVGGALLALRRKQK